MIFDWQNAIALTAVATAAAYLARRSWLAIQHKRAGCGGACATCPSSGTAKTLVAIDLNSPKQPSS